MFLDIGAPVLSVQFSTGWWFKVTTPFQSLRPFYFIYRTALLYFWFLTVGDSASVFYIFSVHLIFVFWVVRVGRSLMAGAGVVRGARRPVGLDGYPISVTRVPGCRLWLIPLWINHMEINASHSLYVFPD